MSFKSLGLSEALLKAVSKKGYTTPSPIQEKAIPLILEGKDVLASAQTGTGKTAGFVLPMLENIEESSQIRTGDERYKIKVLILAPTRELVLQIHQKVEEYGESFTHKSVALYGGIKLGSQVSAIRAGANIAVATTGRLLEHIRNKSINLSEVEMIVLDEADKMLEMGFIADIRAILVQLPKERHSVMFSATFPKPIMSLARSFLKHPITVEVDKENLSAQKVEQVVNYVNEEDKLLLLSKIIKSNGWSQVLVFTNTKLQADKIVETLRASKIKTSAIHGDKSQGMRIEALKNFKSKTISVLVATDVAGRGIDIINLPHVINFELPLNNEDYIHRIGRTGRAGKKGEALSLICKKEVTQLKEIEELINKKLELRVTEGFDYEPHTKVSNRKSKKEDKKSGINLKKARELAEKMMGTKEMRDEMGQNKKKPGGQKPTNKRHF
jgi:ATP-dependent RNA helicase RhlE